MASKSGFKVFGADGDQYLYIETDSGESLAFGADVGTATFNINAIPVSGAIPDEATSNFAIDPSANGDIVLQPNGTGSTVFSDGDVTIVSGNLNLPSTNAALTEGVIEVNSVRFISSIGTRNTFLGASSGNGSLTGVANTGIGANSVLSALTTASSNTAIGDSSSDSITTSSQNTAIGQASLSGLSTGTGSNCSIGWQSGIQLGTGSNNVFLGAASGKKYTTSESSNIIISGVDPGPEVAGESNALRIGAGTGTGTGEQNKAFISGIYGITPSGGNDGMVIIDSNGQLGSQTDLLMPNNPAFSAYLTNSVTNATGDGAVYSINTNGFTEIFDQDGNFDATTGIFTAPVQGIYRFSAYIRVNAITASMTGATFSLFTSNQTYRVGYGSPGSMRSSTNQYSYSLSILADMDASDTAFITIQLSGGASDTAGISSGNSVSYFQGSLVS